MQTLSANGLRLHYRLAGQGRPLLLIAGVGYGAWFWHAIVPGLAEHFYVITFDNRGAGESDKPAGPYSVPMLAADTAGLLDALNLTGVYVLGHSLGGFIAQELAVTRPDLVGKLILAGTHHGGMNVIPITPDALRVLTDRSGDPVELVKRGLTIASAPGFAERRPNVVQTLIDYRLTNPVPPAAYTAQVMAGAGMAQLSEADIARRLGAINMPALILFGESDNVVPPGNADLLAQKLPNAQVKILSGVGHIFPIEDPSATVAAIADFLVDG